MTKKETIQILQSIEDRAVDFPNMTTCDWVAIAAAKRHLENSIDVQEVDLGKEAELIANGIMIGVQSNKYNTVIYNTKRNDFNHSHLMLAARKGIELGIKAQKRE